MISLIFNPFTRLITSQNFHCHAQYHRFIRNLIHSFAFLVFNFYFLDFQDIHTRYLIDNFQSKLLF